MENHSTTTTTKTITCEQLVPGDYVTALHDGFWMVWGHEVLAVKVNAKTVTVTFEFDGPHSDGPYTTRLRRQDPIEVQAR
jgi:hypothetical protein